EDPPGAQPLAAIRSVIESRDLRARHEASWIRAGSFPRRLAVACAALAHGVSPRAIARWVAMQWLPRPYLARIRWSAGPRGSLRPAGLVSFSRREGRNAS